MLSELGLTWCGNTLKHHILPFGFHVRHLTGDKVTSRRGEGGGGGGGRI